MREREKKMSINPIFMFYMEIKKTSDNSQYSLEENTKFIRF